MPGASEYRFLDRNNLPLSFAHRGGAKLRPENTLAAFAHALELGCDVIETDLRMSADGVIVLFHDSDLLRTTGRRAAVNRLTLAELRSLDASRALPSSEGWSEEARRIPTLLEVMERWPQLRLNVEIKEWGPSGYELPVALWSFIQDRSLYDQFLVAAERHELLMRFRQLSGGRVATSASRKECLQFWAASTLGIASRHDWAFQALQVPWHVGALPYVTARLVDAAHESQRQVHVWTIDEPADMATLLALGVDGLMSDRPDRLVEVCRRGTTNGEDRS